MTKRERIEAVLKGRNPQGIPSCFSIHFPPEKKNGEAGIRSHLDFFKRTDVDVMKIMNEHLIPSVPGISVAEDWKKVPSYHRSDAFIQDEADFVKAILDRMEEPAYSLVTIHGICASMVHPCRPQYQPLMEIREMQLRHFREKPEVFLDAAKRITEAQCMMVEETLKAGADGIYYAALGGERSLYTDEEFAQAIAPFDKEIMDVCRKQGKTVLLHMCKTDLDLHRFSSYAPYVDIVNWGVWCNGISLQEGREVFPGKVIMGGLENRSGVIASGSETDLTAEVRSICSSMVGTPFILGADCTLATDVSYERVRTAVEAARNFKGERA